MFLLFHDIGVPSWGLPLFLFSILAGSLSGMFGAVYLFRGNIETSTVVLATLGLIFVAFFCHLFRFDDELRIGVLPLLTVPFGSGISIIAVFAGFATTIVYLLGIPANLICFIGLIRFVELRSKKR